MTPPASVGSSLGVIVTVSDEDTQWRGRVPRRRSERPLQDEWGLFDPARCGLAAVLSRFDTLHGS
jgi:hypothetical protein